MKGFEMKDVKRRAKILAVEFKKSGANIDAELIDKLVERIEDLEDTIQFVERWAVHHGQKPSLSAKEVLSAIQHYPGIQEVTDSYADGIRPSTFNPYERIKELEKEIVDASWSA